MTNHDPIESSLERLKETVSLRADEKAAHKEAVLAFMAKNPARVRSPYAWLLSHGTQVVAGLLVVMVAGGGVASASEAALPGDTLYPVKLKVTEPARTALIFDKEKKTQAKLEHVDKRLKEFALVAASERPDPETTALIAESLSDNIREVSEDVAEFAATEEADTALSVNADLQSVLSAHSTVLDVIEEKNPEAAEDVATISASVETGIAVTENAQQELEEALEPALVDDAPVAEQASETEVSITELLEQVENESASIDTQDLTVITEGLAEVDAIVDEAWTARESGNRKEALLLYTEADQRLSELKTLVEADRDLGIGVVNEDQPVSDTGN